MAETRTNVVSRGILIAGALGLGLSLMAPAEAQQFKWRQNVQWGPTDVNTKYQKLFADRVTERTNGAITIKQFPGSTLMKAKEAAKETSRGTLKIDGNASMFYEGFVPFLKLFSLPFTGLTASDMRDLIKPGSEGRKIVDEALATNNIKLLAFWDGGTAGLVAKEPLPTVDSLKGKKLRIAPKVAGGVLRLIGAQVISMPGSEAVDAMRRGVVEASSIEPKGIISRGYYDVAKFWNDWSILPIGATIMINLEEWEPAAEVDARHRVEHRPGDRGRGESGGPKGPGCGPQGRDHQSRHDGDTDRGGRAGEAPRRQRGLHQEDGGRDRA